MKNYSLHKILYPDKIGSYFKTEIKTLAIVTASGIIYNVGMLAGPYFEGQLAQCLVDIASGKKSFKDMLALSAIYLSVILIVQSARAVKRFGVRKFANNVSRNMRRVIYNSLVHTDKVRLENDNLGSMMTKAVADVDACAEGMRKFTTEIFDTGVVLIAYAAMLFYYDYRLALISCAFTTIAYFVADRLKAAVGKSTADYKSSAGRLNGATMDRISNAMTYRVFGCENNRGNAYENNLTDYEKCAVSANLWENTMQPIYNIISMSGVVFILYSGSKNVLGGGFESWNIAAFTTFLSCFAKMALKSSHAAKLFNSVQKARVSWQRIKPLMHDYIDDNSAANQDAEKLLDISLSDVSAFYSGDKIIVSGVSFSALSGQLIGITGAVASGKSTFGKIFIGEADYSGNILLNGKELKSLSKAERSGIISYMGHEPELISGTIAENIMLGKSEGIEPYLKMVCFEKEVEEMPLRENTQIGNGGICLSGGQQSRCALARTLYNANNLIILDDPFSAVDMETEQEIADNLREYAKKNKKVLFIISHRLKIFPSLDGILFMHDGKADFGTHDYLFNSVSDYRNIFIGNGGETTAVRENYANEKK